MLFNEPKLLKFYPARRNLEVSSSFSALQRAEIAEMSDGLRRRAARPDVSVLFNEPKLLKFLYNEDTAAAVTSFSALQRAEIAEIHS